MRQALESLAPGMNANVADVVRQFQETTKDSGTIARGGHKGPISSK